MKKATGNMYPWVTHTHSHLRGECPHRCSYCYVQAMARRFPNMAKLYSGPLRLDAAALKVNFGSGKTIFIEHMNDLFANGVPIDFAWDVLQHCNAWPNNVYVFQTKNPRRVVFNDWIWATCCSHIRPDKDMFGTTIETNRVTAHSTAPITESRFIAMRAIREKFPQMTLFITIEPVMDFDVDVLLSWMQAARPTFINIGADSKGTGIVEPSAEKLQAFIAGVQDLGIEIRQKTNLDRILKV